MMVTDLNVMRFPSYSAVAENTASNVNIEPEQANGPVVKATDPDTEEEWNTLTYGFKNSSDAALFTIDAASGQLTTNADLDHETQRDYEVIVTVSDGVANEAPDDPDDTIRVIIRVTDDADDEDVANMIPYFPATEGDGLLTTRTVAENTPIKICDISVTPGTPGDPVAADGS